MTHPLLLKYSVGLAIALLCLLAALAVRLTLRRHHSNSLGKKILLHAVQTAFLCAVALVFRQYSGYATHDFHLPGITQRVIDLATIALITLVIVVQLFLLIDLMEKHLVAGGSDPTSARLISRILKITIFILLLLMFGEHLGISVSGLMAFGGVGGIIIGMASKDVLSNLLSGIMLFYDRRFNLGDWISSPDRNIEGTVVEMGWRITKIMTFEQRPLYVPNSVFSAISVENPGRMTNRRIKTAIGVRYEDAAKIRDIVNAIRTMLQNNTKIDQTKTLLVFFDTFADSSLNIMVYCFTKTTVWAQWLEAQQEVYLGIIDIVHQHGADLAFQTQSLYVSQLASNDTETSPSHPGSGQASG